MPVNLLLLCHDLCGGLVDVDECLLAEEVVVILQRRELYFTLVRWASAALVIQFDACSSLSSRPVCLALQGLRFLYLFIGTIFWVLGITALLVSSLTVLILLVCSDVLVVPTRRGKVLAPAVCKCRCAAACLCGNA